MMRHRHTDTSGTSRTRSGWRHGVARALVGVAAALAVVTLLFAGGVVVNAAPPTTTLAWSPTTGTSTFGYGSVKEGATLSQQFTLTTTDNRASAALSVSLTGSTAFSITSDGCSGTSINKGAPSCTVTVQYAPTAAGESDSATLNASSKRADIMSIALSGTSPAPCSVVANLWPPAGIRTAGNMDLLASGYDGSLGGSPIPGSYTTCGDPVEYIWGCFSGTSGDCVSFTDAYNDPPLYDQGIAYIQLNPFDDITITLTICDRNDPSLCAPQITRLYEGAAG